MAKLQERRPNGWRTSDNGIFEGGVTDLSGRSYCKQLIPSLDAMLNENAEESNIDNLATEDKRKKNPATKGYFNPITAGKIKEFTMQRSGASPHNNTFGKMLTECSVNRNSAVPYVPK